LKVAEAKPQHKTPQALFIFSIRQVGNIHSNHQ